MPVALSYSSSTTASSSPGRAALTTTSDVKRLEGRANSVLERGRLPAELAPRPARVGLRVPEEERELAAREERRAADPRGERLAGGHEHVRERRRQPRRYAAAPRHTHHDLGQLGEGHVAVAEDVALAVAAALGRQE